MVPSPAIRRGVFLDRDGTLNVEIEFIHRVEDLRVLPNVAAGLRRMMALGFQLLITTNQSGIGRGYFSEADMRTFNDALCQQLETQGVRIDGIYFCPFHPTAGIGEYRRDSPLRKPLPGMILEAAAEHQLDLPSSFAIGDRKSDVAAGHAAGCRTILVTTGWGGRGEPQVQVQPDFVAADLVEAAEFMERQSGGAGSAVDAPGRPAVQPHVRATPKKDSL
jgi:D-glycero-D-manno-heptose 1,7-bisphosphate phosphatase